MLSSMENSAIEPEKNTNNDELRKFRHDINNQLSNILLAIEQLKYELPDATNDCRFYLDSIAASTNNINELLKAID